MPRYFTNDMSSLRFSSSFLQLVPDGICTPCPHPQQLISFQKPGQGEGAGVVYFSVWKVTISSSDMTFHPRNSSFPGGLWDMAFL